MMVMMLRRRRRRKVSLDIWSKLGMLGCWDADCCCCCCCCFFFLGCFVYLFIFFWSRNMQGVVLVDAKLLNFLGVTRLLKCKLEGVTALPILASLGGTLTLGGDTSGSLAMGRGRRLGCYKVFVSLIYHLFSVRNARAGVRIVKKKNLEQPITEFTLAILVGLLNLISGQLFKILRFETDL